MHFLTDGCPSNEHRPVTSAPATHKYGACPQWLLTLLLHKATGALESPAVVLQSSYFTTIFAHTDSLSSNINDVSTYVLYKADSVSITGVNIKYFNGNIETCKVEVDSIHFHTFIHFFTDQGACSQTNKNVRYHPPFANKTALALYLYVSKIMP